MPRFRDYIRLPGRGGGTPAPSTSEIKEVVQKAVTQEVRKLPKNKGSELRNAIHGLVTLKRLTFTGVTACLLGYGLTHVPADKPELLMAYVGVAVASAFAAR